MLAPIQFPIPSQLNRLADHLASTSNSLFLSPPAVPLPTFFMDKVSDELEIEGSDVEVGVKSQGCGEDVDEGLTDSVAKLVAMSF